VAPRHLPRFGSLQRSPYPLAGFKGAYFKGEGEEGNGSGKGGEEGKERKGVSGGEMKGVSGWGEEGVDIACPDL